MKIAIAATLLASASAFAPSQQGAQKVAPVQATAELDSMVGVGVETGNKIVSDFGDEKEKEKFLHCCGWYSHTFSFYLECFSLIPLVWRNGLLPTSSVRPN